MIDETCPGQRRVGSYAGACFGCQRLRADSQAAPGRIVWHSLRGEMIAVCLDRVPMRHDPYPRVVDAPAPGEPSWRSALAVAAVVVLSLAAAAASAAPVCRWDNPGSDPYRGDPGAAVERLTEIPPDERRTLAAMVRLDYGWERVSVGRDHIDGGRFVDLRRMNFGAGRQCAGSVDRSAWPAGRMEAAKAYTVGRWSVLHFASCNNVALATYTQALAEPLRGRELFEARRSQQQMGPGIGGPIPAPFVPVPEPSSIALGLIGIIAALCMRREGAK